MATGGRTGGMQVKKEDIREKIMNSARGEFLEGGYAGASLRVIAEKANLTKGAVYSYFKNKDALFCELAAPAVNFIESQFGNKACRAAQNPKDAALNSYESTILSFKKCAHAVLNHKESFKLLLFCSAGSSLRDYKERIIRLYAGNFYRLLSFLTKTRPCREGVISEMFVHTLAGAYVDFLEELILHEPEREEADEYAAQMAVFVHSGIEKLYSHKMQ